MWTCIDYTTNLYAAIAQIPPFLISRDQYALGVTVFLKNVSTCEDLWVEVAGNACSFNVNWIISLIAPSIFVMVTIATLTDSLPSWLILIFKE